MPMPTFKNKGGGYQVAFTMSSLPTDVLHAATTSKTEHDHSIC